MPANRANSSVYQSTLEETEEVRREQETPAGFGHNSGADATPKLTVFQQFEAIVDSQDYTPSKSA